MKLATGTWYQEVLFAFIFHDGFQGAGLTTSSELVRSKHMSACFIKSYTLQRPSNIKMRWWWIWCSLLLDLVVTSMRPISMPRRRQVLEGAASLIHVVAVPKAAFGQDYPVTQVDGKGWREVLTSGQYFVLRQGGTEPPFSSPLVSEKRRGVYVCAGCVSPLFDSTQKFESGTGWPSFAAPRVGAVEVVPRLANLLGAEVKCSQCGGHLGDAFSDGSKFPGTPAEVTNNRYCVDGAALVFVPSDVDAGSVPGDGLTGRKRVLPI
jgi:peptide-methionine (R)-S-oxide reductase